MVTGYLCFTTTIGAGQTAALTGSIKNYHNHPLFLYKCYGDTLLLVDSVRTGESGGFAFGDKRFSKVQGVLPVLGNIEESGMYKVILQRNQFFYVLWDKENVEIETLYSPSPFYNIATDSLRVLQSEVNIDFYEFQNLQQQLNVANHWLMEMMRLYPLPDPFHEQIEAEYLKRYEAMEELVTERMLPNIGEHGEQMDNQVALAYYTPVNPDWRQPDPWRDSIIGAHYFDHFKPADRFYLHTNILPEKMDTYLALRTNKRDAYGQPINNEMLFARGAETFLVNTLPDQRRSDGRLERFIETPKDRRVFEFCLNYYLKRFSKEHKDAAFLYVHDHFLKTKEGDCGSQQEDVFSWARRKANVLRGVQIGSIAPDFQITEGEMNMHGLQSDHVLLLFWASWCPHCAQVLPEIHRITDTINSGSRAPKLSTVAISLDTDRKAWQALVQHGTSTWLHTSELKGWAGETPSRYNVYATPTMYVLDKDKRIIARFGSIDQLKEQFAVE